MVFIISSTIFLSLLIVKGIVAFQMIPVFPVVKNHALFSNNKLQLLKMSGATIPLVEPFGKGLKRDIKQKLPFLKSDITDGFNIKSLSSTFFLFFACLAPAVAFGGLLSIATGGSMGTVEAVGATALGGILYSTFSAQPLTIIGTTGPLLAFLKVLFDACKSNNLPFLPIYGMIGLWTSFFLFISSLFSISNIVEYISKFTDDIFSTLISVIFIYEAIFGLIKNFTNPLVPASQALFAMTVALTTFSTANVLSKLKTTPYFPRKARRIITDFAPTIGVLGGTLLSILGKTHYGINLPTLNVPINLATTSGRPWFVNPFTLPLNLQLLCIFPALMATVLLFMDQNITVRLMMSKENKLKKGSGLHLDMFVIATITAITSILGFPWMVAATVRSLAHLSSLQNTETVVTSSVSAEGLATTSTNVVLVGVQEQRVTGFMIHALIAASLLYCRTWLRQIPVSVLTGLFLYLGVSSIDKTDFFQRLKLFITDDKDIPSIYSWSSSIKLGKVKLFTAIQAILLGGMWWIKETKLGVFFPVLIGLLAPIRISLEKFKVFSQEELSKLDSSL